MAHFGSEPTERLGSNPRSGYGVGVNTKLVPTVKDVNTPK